MAEVFINYRTGDGDEAAELIATRLSERFGKEHIFKASHSIQPGELYPQALSDAARKSEVLLAVMGPDWARAPQLQDDADWVRREIQAAQLSGASVVPVLKGRKTDRLARDDLPPELRWLADVHSLLLDMRESTADIKRLGDFLAERLPALKAADRAAHQTTTAGPTTNSVSGTAGNTVQGRDFNGDVRNVNLNDSYGPTTIGDNNTQVNSFLVTYVGARLRAAHPRQQPIDQLRRLAQRFVPPPGFDAAVAVVEEHGTVILDGFPGSGRSAAAQMILLKSWSGGGLESWPGKGRFHELLIRKPDNESPYWLDPDDIGIDDRVWVDLSDADPLLWDDIQLKELSPLRTCINARRARLVVIQPHGEDPHPQFRAYKVNIGRPQPLELFRHLLGLEGLLSAGEVVDLPSFLSDAPSMEDIQRFIDNILDAKNEPGNHGSLTEWIVAAGEPTPPREKQVSKALRTLPRAQDRALLLTTAMLHGAHADVIDHASAALLSGFSSESPGSLEGSPLGQRLHAIGAKADVAGHVRFIEPGYEIAVRSFFWRHYPELHEALASIFRVRDLLA